ncbi:MAG: phosphoenolpyruvate carboxykinase (ATP) [Chitinophagaceae bacterium]|nr:MAG: phosphoenolpyruvate carboxykinase (ATP) [Chitinophagaceae bacterium]
MGIEVNSIHYQLPPGDLTRQTLALKQGELDDKGALCVNTGKFTGRSPRDRYIVKDAATRNAVDWGDVNIPFDADKFDRLYDKVCSYLSNQKEVWVRDSYACASDRYRLNVRVITDTPWANLFCHHLFLRPDPSELPYQGTDWLIIQAPGFNAVPGEDGTRQENFSILNFTRKIILIGGTAYTGEIKKALFGVLNFILPYRHKVLSMHCAANEGRKGDVALFFGLSGTGKTTLSTDPSRALIGDDEHGWAEGTVFNFEGGCYAKCIRLDPEKEPQIFSAIRSTTLLENVVFHKNTNSVNFDDESISENTRAAYPIDFINNAKQPSVGGNPRNIFFLTCDASGVLPPISKLDKGQAMFHYISGYTAKIAGTEIGIAEPQPVFSACFGRVFLPLNPVDYAELLGGLLGAHPEINVWLVNTGWTGGGYGRGTRISLSYTRAMIRAALNGDLANVNYHVDEHFNFRIPETVPGVPGQILNPRLSWQNENSYDEAANHLAELFIRNFEKYSGKAGAETKAAVPRMLT